MVWITQIYCGNPDCNARECEVITKDHGDNPEPTEWHCPACGVKAKVHWRHDLATHERRELEIAIGRVNASLYVRDHDTCMVPLKAVALDELPSSWKYAEA